MINLNQFKNFYLMGIKGVAMTSLAQILLDAGKKVEGCDLAEEFVTQDLLKRIKVKIELGFEHPLPKKTDCLIYTAAHGGPENPLVIKAVKAGIPTFSQAEALSYFFNQKQGIAVCGVGGKTTVSAMIAWILEKNNQEPSYSVGVGKIAGLARTGQWHADSKYFVAEADEYVINPNAVQNGEEIIPRFSFLKPHISVCTNLEYDHPDVYTNLEHTQKVFGEFLTSTQPNGFLIVNHDNPELTQVIQQQAEVLKQKNITIRSFGQNPGADWQLLSSEVRDQKNIGQIKIDDKTYELQLPIPGDFNLLNALAAGLAAACTGMSIDDSLTTLEDFHGTQRRFELIGQKNGVTYYDDYAHHPHEIKKTIQALKDWHPQQRRVVAFQPHTYSRTKELFDEFVDALGTADELILLDIFASAREKSDPTVSSNLLLEHIRKNYPQVKVANLKFIEALADYCQHQLFENDVFLSMGAGDIYQIYDLLNLNRSVK